MPTMAPSVGGSTTEHNEAKPFTIRTFAVAAYLLAKSYRLLAVELADGGIAGEVVFVFEPAASVGMAEYYQDREHLSRLMNDARRRR